MAGSFTHHQMPNSSDLKEGGKTEISPFECYTDRSSQTRRRYQVIDRSSHRLKGNDLTMTGDCATSEHSQMRSGRSFCPHLKRKRHFDVDSFEQTAKEIH